jgi:hypothetical protein
VLEPTAFSTATAVRDSLLSQLGGEETAAALDQLDNDLRSLAAELSAAGVRIEPRFTPDLCLLAQLCAIDSQASLDLDSLIYVGPNLFSPDGMTVRTRSSHVRVHPPGEVGRIQQALLEADPAYRDIRPSAHETGRAGGLMKGSAAARLDALVSVLDAHPSLPDSNRSAARVIRESWGRRGAGLAMQQMTGSAHPPSESTLAKDLSKARKRAT